MSRDLRSALLAEALGTALLLAAVVGSGIMGERLAGGNDAVALLANTAATGAALFVLIATLAPFGGAHFNPAVTMVAACRGALPWPHAVPYMLVQVAAAVAGVWLAHLMFDLPVLQTSEKVRAGLGQWTGEFVATFSLLLVILLGNGLQPGQIGARVAAIIVAAYWFTSSTSFANPAVTIARSLSDSFAGIRPADAPFFILAQCLGAAAAVLAASCLLTGRRDAPAEGTGQAARPRCGRQAGGPNGPC
jgi:glycerol uptake facilitator-like aquaporin